MLQMRGFRDTSGGPQHNFLNGYWSYHPVAPRNDGLEELEKISMTMI